MKLNKEMRECLLSKLNKLHEKIEFQHLHIRETKKEKNRLDLMEWLEIELILLEHRKDIIENSLIDNCIEEV